MVIIPDNELEYVYYLALQKYKEWMPDIVANTVMNMIRFNHRYDPSKGKRTTWIYAIMLNLVRQAYAKRKRDRKIKTRLFSECAFPGGDIPEFNSLARFDDLELIEFRYDVNQVKHKLTGRQREFVDLVMSGFSIEDIADILGMTNRKSYFELEKRTRVNIKKLLNV